MVEIFHNFVFVLARDSSPCQLGHGHTDAHRSPDPQHPHTGHRNVTLYLPGSGRTPRARIPTCDIHYRAAPAPGRGGGRGGTSGSRGGTWPEPRGSGLRDGALRAPLAPSTPTRCGRSADLAFLVLSLHMHTLQLCGRQIRNLRRSQTTCPVSLWINSACSLAPAATSSSATAS